MEITTSTDSLLIAKCGSRISLWFFGAFMIGLSVIAFASKTYGPGLLMFAVGASCFALNSWWKLTINKQASTVEAERWMAVKLIHKDNAIPVNNIAAVRYQETRLRSVTTVTISFNLRDANTPVIFCKTRPHYYRGALLGAVSLNAKTKEQDAAIQIAQFIGVACYDTVGARLDEASVSVG